MAAVITFHTGMILDRAALSLIREGLRASKWTRGAAFEIAEPNAIDGEGSITITGNPGGMIDPGEVFEIIESALG